LRVACQIWLSGQLACWQRRAVMELAPATVQCMPDRLRRRPKVVLRRVQEVAGHKIGEDTWYTAIVDWILVGRASVPNASSTPLAALHVASVPTWIACQWRTKLLFSSRPGEPPTLLQFWPPEALDPAEQDEWQPLVRKAVPQITTPQFPDFATAFSAAFPADVPSGGPLALLITATALMTFAKKRRDGSIAGSSDNLLDGLGDTPGNSDPPDSST
jgi:hypothetical protein